MKKIQKVNIDDLASICSHFRLNRSPQQKQTLFSNFAFMHSQVEVKKLILLFPANITEILIVM